MFQQFNMSFVLALLVTSLNQFLAQFRDMMQIVLEKNISG